LRDSERGDCAVVLVRYVHRVKARIAVNSAAFVESETGFCLP
tara:strand:+ start:3691 stop:3816 length:126 start_codon:yes stop_codon:yes gene_type:complete